MNMYVTNFQKKVGQEHNNRNDEAIKQLEIQQTKLCNKTITPLKVFIIAVG